MAGTSSFDLTRYAIRSRPDLSASLTHWTRAKGDKTAFEILKKIILERKINASNETGFIKGGQVATCFTETPVGVMARLFRAALTNKATKRYVKWEPFGITFSKRLIFKTFDGRPTISFTEMEYDTIVRGKGLMNDLAWRVVTLEHEYSGESIDFTHEREWRVHGDVLFESLEGFSRPLIFVNFNKEIDDLYQFFPQGPNCPFRGVLSIQDLILT